MVYAEKIRLAKIFNFNKHTQRKIAPTSQQ